MKYHIITYGCQMNESDSERIASVLEKTGYKFASNINEADLILVNMCSVRQSAVDRIFGLSRKFTKLKTLNPKLKTILTGCILKEDKNKFGKKPAPHRTEGSSAGFDLILNIKDLSEWPKFLALNKIITSRSLSKTSKNYFSIRPKYKTNFSAFIPISNGCNNFCSFCVVPYVRGSLVCHSHKEILKEAKNAVKRGFKEIWFLGQNVNDYTSPIDSFVNFPKLLKIVNDIPGNFWIRFTSPHPKDFSDELIEAMAESKKVTEYLNLPVQSGDDEILKKMNRPYTVGQYKNLVKKIRQKIPEITLSTDAIVGFPGETKKQFENTVKLFKEIKFDMAYIAKYSPRPGTAALKLKNDVPYQEKERRWKILAEILKETALKKNKKYIGRHPPAAQEVEVLPEKASKGFLIGKTRTYKTVKFKGKENLIGQFVKIKIINAMPWGLKGKLTS